MEKCFSVEMIVDIFELKHLFASTHTILMHFSLVIMLLVAKVRR